MIPRPLRPSTLMLKGAGDLNMADKVHFMHSRLLFQPVPLDPERAGERHGKIQHAEVDQVMEIMRPLAEFHFYIILRGFHDHFCPAHLPPGDRYPQPWIQCAQPAENDQNIGTILGQ